MPVTLAAATPNDLKLLSDSMRQLRADDPMPTEHLVGFDTSLAAMAGLLDDPDVGRVWIVLEDGQPAGYIVLTFGYSIEFGGRTAVVDEFFIDSAHRGRGVGRAALQLLVDEARKHDVRVMFLEATPSNLPAQRLYRRAGFVERSYRLMWKPLTPKSGQTLD